MLAGIEKDSCSSGVCLCWGLARLYQYNLLLLGQHGLIWVNLHPVTTHLAHKHTHARTQDVSLPLMEKSVKASSPSMLATHSRVWYWPCTLELTFRRLSTSLRPKGDSVSVDASAASHWVAFGRWEHLWRVLHGYIWLAETGLTGFILILCQLSLSFFSGKYLTKSQKHVPCNGIILFFLAFFIARQILMLFIKTLGATGSGRFTNITRQATQNNGPAATEAFAQLTVTVTLLSDLTQWVQSHLEKKENKR